MQWAGCRLGCFLLELPLAQLLGEQGGWVRVALVVLQGSLHGEVLLLGTALLGCGIRGGILPVVERSQSGEGQ